MTISAELERIARQEEKLRRQHHREPAQWKVALESKVPPKIYDNLKSVFAKVFQMIFEKGTDLIERTYHKEEIEKDFKVRDYAVSLEMNSRNLALLDVNAQLSNLVSLAVSTAEGVGLGALGIGLPDIVLFVSMILRSCYETALRYGFPYDSNDEKWFILHLLAGSLKRGEDWDACNQKIDDLIFRPFTPTKEQLDDQARKTADAFAVDMLLTKFIQGLPFVGIVGGAANPYYYRKILGFVRLKYRKRYLIQKTDTNITKTR
jgi:hypothetical protein